MIDTPVLFIVFNRPELTARVFNAIRQARPEQLFIAADGPRAGNFEDERHCDEVRSIVGKVDWECHVQTLYRNENLGCGNAVSGAINWFFSQVQMGIILEDDCLPAHSFFPFCKELLEKYEEDPAVMAICGINLLPGGWKSDQQSYLFGHGGIWGWATWKRAWEKYDFEMRGWEDESNRQRVRNTMKNDDWFRYYEGMLTGTWKKEINTWDIQWFYTIMVNGGLSINPTQNLVKNIGFGKGSTHTGDSDSRYATLKLSQMNFPLIHPPEMSTDLEYLKDSFRYITSVPKRGFFRKALSFVYRKVSKFIP